MPYEPKFHSGETVELNSKYLDCEQFIIIGTWISTLPYFRGQLIEEYYDERDSEHTLYATINTKNKKITWYWENDFEPTSYCKNTERGKLILKENILLIDKRYNIRPEKMDEFLENFIRILPHERIDTFNPINPMLQVISSALDDVV